MKKSLVLMILFFCFFMVYSALTAEQKPVMAPDFSLVDLSNRLVNLSDLKGKNVVLVFYVGHG